MIRIENVTKKFKTGKEEILALSDVSFELPNTGFVALCGENGCGKTTLLNLISSIMSGYTGKIFIDNLDINKHSEYVKGNLVSYVLQDDCFLKALTIEETLLLETDDGHRVQEELETIGIFDKALNKPNELSGGQRQRASFVRGILKESAILLVDEPTSSMDEEMEKVVFDRLKELSKSKLVVLVSHNLSMVYEYSDIVIKLNKGKVESITRNTSAADIVYKENEILFSGELNFRSIEKNIASKMLETFGQIIIKKTEKKSTSFECDYSPRIHNDTKLRKKLTHNQIMIMLKSMIAESAKIVISLAIILGIFLVPYEAMLDLREFDANEFIFNSVKENEEKFVSTILAPARVDSEIFTYYDVLELERLYHPRLDVVSAWESSYDLECGYDDFYNTSIQGTSRSYLTEKDMVYGAPPVDDQIAMSDYLADALIRKTEFYSSYEDIIKNGIFVGAYHLEVCGIVDTDYEKYQDLDDDKWNKKDTENFSIMQMKWYTILFKDAKTDIPSKLRFANIISGDCLADIMPNDLEGEACAVNQVLAEIIGYDGTGETECKTEFGYMLITSIIEDDSENPTLYVSNEVYISIANSGNTEFDYINVEINSKELVSFLSSKSIKIDSYTGNYTSKIIEIIEILGYFFDVLNVIILVALSMFLFFMVRRISRANNKLFAFQKLSGYMKRYYFLLELSLIAISILATIMVNACAYYLGYYLLNTGLSKSFNISVCFMMNSISTWIIVSVGVLFLSIVFELICYLLRDKKEIIRLLK